MPESLAALRRTIARLEGGGMRREGPDREKEARLATGLDVLDRVLGTGIAGNALHEIHGAEARSAGAASGFVAALLARAAALDSMDSSDSDDPRKPVLWVQDPVSASESGRSARAGACRTRLRSGPGGRGRRPLRRRDALGTGGGARLFRPCRRHRRNPRPAESPRPHRFQAAGAARGPGEQARAPGAHKRAGNRFGGAQPLAAGACRLHADKGATAPASAARPGGSTS